MARNQPLAFAALIGGGVLATAALSGESLAAVLSGQVQHLKTPTTGMRMSAGLANAINSTGAYVNPFGHAHPSNPTRVDMGVDYALQAGDPILAPGNSKYMGLLSNWYAGQPLIWFQFLDGPRKGQYWYVSEQISPVSGLVAGQTTVAAGQPVAHYAASGTAIEAGFATATGQTLSAAHGTANVPNHSNTPEGKEWDAFIKALGGPHVY